VNEAGVFHWRGCMNRLQAGVGDEPRVRLMEATPPPHTHTHTHTPGSQGHGRAVTDDDDTLTGIAPRLGKE